MKMEVLGVAQFTIGEARRLVDRIKATGKNLSTVYVAHGHPHHYWGLNAIRDAFPSEVSEARRFGPRS